MSLDQLISADMKEAMKAKNNATLSTLRLLRSALKNKEIDVQHALSDEEVLAVIKYSVKQLMDGIASYQAAGRTEMVVAAQKEIQVLEKYLPAQMPDEQLEEIVRGAIAQTGATSKQEMGKVMGVAVKAVEGQADGSRIKAIVERLLPVVVCVLVGVATASTTFAANELLPQQLTYYPFAETAVRVIRVLLLGFGLVSVNKILHGGFSYMVASMRDTAQESAMGEITSGFVMSIVIVLMYTLSTYVIRVI